MSPREDPCLPLNVQDYLKPKTIEIKPKIPEHYNLDQRLLHLVQGLGSATAESTTLIPPRSRDLPAEFTHATKSHPLRLVDPIADVSAPHCIIINEKWSNLAPNPPSVTQLSRHWRVIGSAENDGVIRSPAPTRLGPAGSRPLHWTRQCGSRLRAHMK
jgi:hypothetical protein